MAKDSFYFPHDSSARNDEKIIALRMKHNWQGYGLYWAIIEKLREATNNECVKDYNLIAFDLRTDANLIKSIIETFGLFVFTEDGKYFYSERLKRTMTVIEQKSEKAKESARSKWGVSSNTDLSKSAIRSLRMSDARKKGTHTEQEWLDMKSFFKTCVKCNGISGLSNLEKDHIVPVYQGGSDGIDNIQPMCAKCNSSKGSDTKDYRLDYCLRNACEMPAKFLLIKEKESKLNEIKEKEKEIPTNSFSKHLKENFKNYKSVAKDEWGLDMPFKFLLMVDDFEKKLEKTHLSFKDFESHFLNWGKIFHSNYQDAIDPEAERKRALTERERILEKQAQYQREYDGV